ncbi:MAG: 3-dehydroquinate synthase, partial [Gammaproteobacteria bacterium]|nr:3-dehydroquinate synthase [Gammaproteobacteria bacterium]
PTTLLAQVDSSVGGKTGVNHRLGKNMIGAFYQPRAVIIDTDTLSTLPEREYRAGLAEVIKYGLIRDVAFLHWLAENMPLLLQRDASSLQYAIYQSCKCKAAVVAADETEAGVRAILNFGHTFGHAVETATQYQTWLHGEAVALGMLIALEFSHRCGLLQAADVELASRVIRAAGLPDKAPANAGSAAQLVELMSVDKKVQQGRIRLVLLKALGEAFVTADFDSQLLEPTIQDYL